MFIEFLYFLKRTKTLITKDCIYLSSDPEMKIVAQTLKKSTYGIDI